MSRILTVFAVLALFLAPAQQAPVAASNRALFDEIDPVLRDLTGITRLEPRRAVDRDFITREKLKQFLESRIAETIDPKQLRAEELTLKLFGFVPEDYDLKSSTISLLTEQAAAFYDYNKKKLFVLEGAPEFSQKYLLVHELAHALADQHFSLEKFIRKGATDDSATARMAVMEGQAQWLMYEVISRPTGQSLRTDPGLVRMMANLSSAGLAQYPELSSAPLYIRESLLFPYSHGLLFQQAVVDKLGERAFREVFRRPPASSQQILHPDLYFSGQKAVKVKLPAAAGAKDQETVAEGELGEFDLQLLLRQFAGEAEAADLAPAWRGGRYRVIEHKSGKQPRLIFALQFSGAAEAAEFAALYETKILPAKKKPSGSATVSTTGSLVSITEGLH